MRYNKKRKNQFHYIKKQLVKIRKKMFKEIQILN